MAPLYWQAHTPCAVRGSIQALTWRRDDGRKRTFRPFSRGALADRPSACKPGLGNPISASQANDLVEACMGKSEAPWFDLSAEWRWAARWRHEHWDPSSAGCQAAQCCPGMAILQGAMGAVMSEPLLHVDDQNDANEPRLAGLRTQVASQQIELSQLRTLLVIAALRKRQQEQAEGDWQTFCWGVSVGAPLGMVAFGAGWWLGS